MQKLFMTVLEMSAIASYCIIIVCVVRFFLKSAPKIFSYALWAVVAFRLICPVSLESPASLIGNDIYYYTYDNNGEIYVSSSYSGENNYEADNTSEISFSIEQLIPYVWLSVTLAMFIYCIYSNISIKVKLRHKSYYLETYGGVRVFVAQGIISPFILGFAKPVIYLPDGLDNASKNTCLAHEYTHIRRFDHITKQLAFLLVSIHWFNPLVWLAFKLMSKDMECSCDEYVLRNAELDDRKHYSNLLLGMARKKGFRFVGAPLAFAENDLKSRIKNILNYRKPNFLAVTGCIIAVAICILGLSLNPVSAKSETPDEMSDETVDNETLEHEYEALRETKQQYSEQLSALNEANKIFNNPINEADEVTALKQMCETTIHEIGAYVSQRDCEEAYINQVKADGFQYDGRYDENIETINSIITTKAKMLEIYEQQLDGYDLYLEKSRIYSGEYISQNSGGDNSPVITIHTYNHSFSIDSDSLSTYGTYRLSDGKIVCNAYGNTDKFVFGIISESELEFDLGASNIPSNIDGELGLDGGMKFVNITH